MGTQWIPKVFAHLKDFAALTNGKALRKKSDGTGVESFDAQEAIVIQSLGVKNVDFTIDATNGLYAKVTTGSANINMTLTNGASATTGNRLFVEIAQGATARVVTLKPDANVISSGGLMSSGDALPNSGNSTVDLFEFVWNGLKWEVINALFDVKA